MAQQIQLMYQDSFGPGEGEFLAYADELPSKDIIVIGGKRASVNPNSNFEPLDYYIARLDSNLNLIWEQSIGDPNYSEYWCGTIKTSQGNYVVTGTRETPPNGNFYNPEAFCVDSNGNILWQQYYDLDYDSRLYRSCQYSNGNILLAAGCETGPLTWTPRFVLIDEDGNEIWRTGAESSMEGFYIEAINSCPDNGFITLGHYSNFPGYSFITKHDSGGILQWVEYPYGTNDTIGVESGGIFCKSDGTIISLFLEEWEPFSGSQQTIWKEYDSNGNFETQVVLPFYLFANARMLSPLPLTTKGSKMITLTNPYNGSGQWMLEFDLDRNIGNGVHFSGIDSMKTWQGMGFWHGIQLSDGGYLGVGSTCCGITSQFYFVRFARDGRYQTQDYATTVTINPNPSPDGNFTFEFDAQKDETVTINIWSTTGQIVYTNTVFCPAGHQMDLVVSLQRESCPSGTYFFEATASENALRKILIIARSEE